jgi:hypothetical protein
MAEHAIAISASILLFVFVVPILLFVPVPSTLPVFVRFLAMPMITPIPTAIFIARVIIRIIVRVCKTARRVFNIRSPFLNRISLVRNLHFWKLRD